MTTALILVLVFGIAGFLILWFAGAPGGNLRIQLLGAALLAGAFAVLLSLLVGRVGASHVAIPAETTTRIG
jgi:membrane protein implicated in regulation of membrane protease activity